MTVMNGRKTLVSLSVSGLSSLNEVYRHVMASAAGQKGIVTLYLRNSTQGWVQQHTMVLNRQTGTSRGAQTRPQSYPSLFGSELFES